MSEPVRDAAERLLAGQPAASDGALTVVALAAEERRLRQTIASHDLRHQVTQLTLAAAVLAQGQAETRAAPRASGNVVPLRPDTS